MSSRMPGMGRPCSSISSTCMYDMGALPEVTPGIVPPLTSRLTPALA